MHPIDDKTKLNANPIGQSVLTIFANIFWAMVGAYGLSTMLHIILMVTIGEQWVVVAFFNTFAHLLWIPALVLLPVALLMRRWQQAALLVPAVVAFALIFGGQFITSDTPIADDKHDTAFKIMTYNLLAGRTTASYDASFDIIRAADADIVALQEIGLENGRRIYDELGDLYPYIAMHPQAQGTAGQGILSRYPILDDDFWRYDWLYIPLGHQRATLEINGEPVVIYNVHPSHPGMTGRGVFVPDDRSRELTDIAQRIRQETQPVILLGDFNMPELADDYRMLNHLLQDAYQQVGYGMGWTYGIGIAPLMIPLRIDYIFYSGDALQPHEAHVWPYSGGSDHRPLWAIFTWR